ncbi:MAG: hypothetical protein ABIO24_04810 [Saprospiraceae bacterium]
MKFAFYFNALLCCVVLFAFGCQKDQPVPSVTIDIKVPAPVITTLSNGQKKLDFTVEVTQTGDFFYQDFNFRFTQPDSSLVLDTYYTLLSSGHEFVHHTVTASHPGIYMVDVFIGPADGGGGSGSTVVVPQ